MSKKIYIILAFILVILIFFTVFLMVNFKNKTGPANFGESGRIHERVLIIGELVEVSRNLVLVKELPGPIPEESARSFSVKIDGNTVFCRQSLEKVDSNDFILEQEKYNKEVLGLKEAGKSTFAVEAPSWFVCKPIALSDIKAGEKVKAYVDYFSESKEYYTKKIIFEYRGEINEYAGEGNEVLELVSGRVKDISSSSFVVSAADFASEGEKEVFWNQDSSFVLKTKKSEVQFQAEEAEFLQIKQEQKDNRPVLGAPSWFTESPASINDIKISSEVVVHIEARSGIAKKIEILKP